MHFMHVLVTSYKLKKWWLLRMQTYKMAILILLSRILLITSMRKLEWKLKVIKNLERKK